MSDPAKMAHWFPFSVWGVCLGELDKHLEGRRAGGPHDDAAEPWQGNYEICIAVGMPRGAEIPTASAPA